MRTSTIVIFIIINLLLFSSFLFGQKMTSQQELIVEKVEKQNKTDTERQNEIRKQIGLNNQQKSKSEFFWEDGIGLTNTYITQNRQMSQFVRGGHIDCRDWAAKDKLSSECINTAIGDFIWRMWSEKKRGYITISGDSRDSLSTSHIFIEPDEKENFQIVWRTIRWSALSGSNYWIQDEPKIISVNCIENKSKKGQGTLFLKNEAGKIIGELLTTFVGTIEL